MAVALPLHLTHFAGFCNLLSSGGEAFRCRRGVLQSALSVVYDDANIDMTRDIAGRHISCGSSNG